MPQLIDQGNVTCQGRFLPDVGEYLVASGNTCQLYCRPGFVSLELKTTRCLSGRWSRRLACVRPDAMLIIGGRSNTQAGKMLKADFELARLFTIPNISILSQYFLDFKVSLNDNVNTLQKDCRLSIEKLIGDPKKGRVESKGYNLKGFQGLGSCDGFNKSFSVRFGWGSFGSLDSLRSLTLVTQCARSLILLEMRGQNFLLPLRYVLLSNRSHLFYT